MDPRWLTPLAITIIVILLVPGGARAVFWVGIHYVFRIVDLIKTVFMLTVVPLVLALSRPAPFVSRKLGVDDDIINDWIRQRIRDGVLGMREHVFECLRRRNLLPANVNHDETRAKTIQYTTTVSDRYRTGELIIAVVGGIVSLAASPLSLPYRALPILSFYLVLLPISMALRTATVDVLMYDREAVNTVSAPKLAFMRHWNKAIAEDDGTIAYHLFVGLAKGESEYGFELGKQVIEDVTVNEKEFEDAVENVITEAMGEDAKVPDWLKSRLREYRTGV